MSTTGILFSKKPLNFVKLLSLVVSFLEIHCGAYDSRRNGIDC
jgi:hypothetical protein